MNMNAGMNADMFHNASESETDEPENATEKETEGSQKASRVDASDIEDGLSLAPPEDIHDVKEDEDENEARAAEVDGEQVASSEHIDAVADENQQEPKEGDQDPIGNQDETSAEADPETQPTEGGDQDEPENTDAVENTDETNAGIDARIEDTAKPEEGNEQADSDMDLDFGTATTSTDRFKRKHVKPPRKKIGEDMIAEEDDDNNETSFISPSQRLESVSQNFDDSLTDKYKAELDYQGTPDRLQIAIDEEHQNEDEEPEIQEEVKLTREEIISKYQAALEERERHQTMNNQLQNKLSDYFRKKKSDDMQSQSLFDKSSQDQEQRYIKYLNQIEELHKQLEKQRLIYENEKYELSERCELRQELVDEERGKYIKLKKDIALKAISTQTGKTVSLKEIESYLLKEQQKEQDVIEVRLENIKLKNQLKKKETQLKAKEELGDGLHLIDFEQLKIENQTYNEKIEERNEELMKLKKKINNTVQILTHVKEKLKFVIAENEKEKEKLSIFDDEVKKKRDILNHTKQSRDSLRVDNNRLKQSSGLLGNTKLLRDFEICVDKNEELHNTIEQLKRRHAELVLDSQSLKKKISQVKTDK